MNTLKTIRTAILVSVIAAALLSPAAAGAAKNDPPGFIDLSWIEIPAGAVEVQELDLTALLADMAVSAQEEDDSELARLLTMVNTLQVKGFTLPGDDTATRRAVERVEKMLTDDGWSRIVYFKDEDETTSVSIRNHDGRVVGLTVVTYEPGGQVAFINATGKLDFGALLSLAETLQHVKDVKPTAGVN